MTYKIFIQLFLFKAIFLTHGTFICIYVCMHILLWMCIKSLQKNGEKYSGFFKDNLEDGNGRYRFTNGVYREGAWLKGKRVRWLSGDKMGGMPTV